MNRLNRESSPYLLEHAGNPVDWYPWGEEAFEKAKREGKPILLSIGYSSCHWCHVMAKESFEDAEIARALNENYVSIKVDREERPDLDAAYMAAVTAMTGSGGWPMTVWLTPEGKPYFGGTYFPPRDGERGARAGFLTLLLRLRQAYDANPRELKRQAAEWAERLSRARSLPPSSRLPSPEALGRLAAWADEAYDETNGGFGSAPKFPRPVLLDALLRHGRRSGNLRTTERVLATLRKMARGGIYDQVGGGFHRYSVDAAWRVPHFEKMLYDNAQLARIYLSAYQVSHDGELARVARETLDYVAREMTDTEGGFHSATDADSEGEEGRYFLWSEEEIRTLLGAEASDFCSFHGVTPGGNFEGGNILYRATDAPASEAIERGRRILREARQRRVPPATDDKVLTSWNGLMIGAFARGGFVLGDSSYLERGARAASFLLAVSERHEGLPRFCRKGVANGKGFLDDHAFLASALLDLYEATGEGRWLSAAEQLTEVLLERFRDREGGGFFLSSPDHDRLFAREKPYDDGSEPSGNAVAAMNLLRLEAITGRAVYGERAQELFKAFGDLLSQVPQAAPALLCALDFRSDDGTTVAVAPPLDEVLRRTYLPNVVRLPAGGNAVAQVCRRGRCEAPTDDPEQLAKLLEPTPFGIRMAPGFVSE